MYVGVCGLSPWKKSSDKTRQCIKTRDNIWPAKLCRVKGMVFPVVMCGCGSCSIKNAESLQSFPTLCNSTNCSPLGSAAHGILQARYLKWVVLSYLRGSLPSRDWTPSLSCVSCISSWTLYHCTTWEAPGCMHMV